MVCTIDYESYSDWYVMCMVFNAFIRLTNTPFGFVDKIYNWRQTFISVDHAVQDKRAHTIDPFLVSVPASSVSSSKSLTSRFSL
jgi:hypothetical protein